MHNLACGCEAQKFADNYLRCEFQTFWEFPQTQLFGLGRIECNIMSMKHSIRVYGIPVTN